MMTRNNHSARFVPIGLLFIAVATVGFRAGSQSTSSAVPTPKLAFEVAAIRPSGRGPNHEDWDSGGDRVSIRGYSLRKLIKAAFNLKSDAQIVGGPDWLDTKYFDISAKIGDEQAGSFRALGADRGHDEQTAIRSMLQTLLDKRFHLRAKPVERHLPIFGLVVSASKPGLTRDSTQSRHLSIQNAHMVASATSMEELAESLSGMREVGDRLVIDQTGLIGTYDFTLVWTPDRGAGVSEQADYPGLFTALQEQLGLKLKPEKSEVRAVEVLAAEVPDFD